MMRPYSWCIAALPLGNAAYLSKTWCYFAFEESIANQNLIQALSLYWSDLIFIFFLTLWHSLPWQSAVVLVLMMSSFSLPATTRGDVRALVIHWQLPLLAFSAEDRLHLLIYCAFALFDLPGFKYMVCIWMSLWLYREKEDCCDWQGNWTVCSPSM